MSFDLAEDRVSRVALIVEPVEEAVVDRVDKELRAPRVGASVGHRQGARLVGDLGGVLVRDRAAAISLGGALARDLVRRVGSRAASTVCRVLRILRIGAPELQHEVVDHPVSHTKKRNHRGGAR